MPKTRRPHYGSLQFWPRKRAKRIYARVRSKISSKEAKPLEFAGYKVGMTHLAVTDNRPKSTTKGEEIIYPVTIIECPPIKTSSIRFYKNTTAGSKLCSEVFSEKLDKELERKLRVKSVKKKVDDVKDFDDIKVSVHTNPKLTTIGKKKPEFFEICIGGSKEDKLKWAKENLGKEININDVFQGGQQIDVHAVTKGKGYQGPVKRFGIGLKHHKSEKGVRRVGSLGGWKAQGHFMWKVAHAGQMGYHQRTEYNKWILKIGTKPEEINTKSGFVRYGLIKNPYIIVKGSILGPSKRLIRFNSAIRGNRLVPKEAPSITYINLDLKK
ncbi:50S ribosomal protein L3 [Candidatus Woesearchaeota archaeon]|nr:50S ribosomal protein L3 [Candidatus Woesearchaeota archaeon]